MTRTTLKRLASVGALLMAMFVLSAAPALAGGNSSSKTSSDHTEDNDTNDNGTPNNVSDDGDNRHPSGRDKSTENGNSGNQGNSGSDPDGASNGGADKPNGSGGTDKSDQDGNNGCGNDDDFEDDNNGNCGKPADTTGQSCPANGKSEGQGNGHGKGNGSDDCDQAGGNRGNPTECLDADGMDAGFETCGENGGVKAGNRDSLRDHVLGSIIGNGVNPGDEVLGNDLTNDHVLAAGAERDANGSSLPFTGAAIGTLIALGAALIGFGYLFTHKRSRLV